MIPCANGTDALQIAMMGLGLKPGDEVITSSFIYVATTEVITLLGLTPVLVEVDEDTFLIDPERIEGAITTKTKPIVPVFLGFVQIWKPSCLLRINTISLLSKIQRRQ